MSKSELNGRSNGLSNSVALQQCCKACFMVVAPADYYAWEVFVIKTGKVLERVHDGCKEKFIQEILPKLGYEESQIGFRHFAEDKQTLPEYLGQVRSVFVTSSSGGGDPEN